MFLISIFTRSGNPPLLVIEDPLAGEIDAIVFFLFLHGEPRVGGQVVIDEYGKKRKENLLTTAQINIEAIQS